MCQERHSVCELLSAFYRLETCGSVAAGAQPRAGLRWSQDALFPKCGFSTWSVCPQPSTGAKLGATVFFSFLLIWVFKEDCFKYNFWLYNLLASIIYEKEERKLSHLLILNDIVSDTSCCKACNPQSPSLSFQRLPLSSYHTRHLPCVGLDYSFSEIINTQTPTSVNKGKWEAHSFQFIWSFLTDGQSQECVDWKRMMKRWKSR